MDDYRTVFTSSPNIGVFVRVGARPIHAKMTEPQVTYPELSVAGPHVPAAKSQDV